ncbi:hypothetical protein SDC9_155906 [bioreactor metagenome]|uniref:Uncharacterized protein n=1 Tax=bioreactor metagenome TaxID=1076179 RepID=A0A645F2Z0_9ZZZZ
MIYWIVRRRPYRSRSGTTEIKEQGLGKRVLLGGQDVKNSRPAGCAVSQIADGYGENRAIHVCCHERNRISEGVCVCYRHSIAEPLDKIRWRPLNCSGEGCWLPLIDTLVFGVANKRDGLLLWHCIHAHGIQIGEVVGAAVVGTWRKTDCNLP